MKFELTDERPLILTHWLLMEAIPTLAIDEVLVNRKDVQPSGILGGRRTKRFTDTSDRL